MCHLRESGNLDDRHRDLGEDSGDAHIQKRWFIEEVVFDKCQQHEQVSDTWVGSQ